MQRRCKKVDAIREAQNAIETKQDSETKQWSVGTWFFDNFYCGNDNGLDYATARHIYCQSVAQCALNLMYGFDNSSSENEPNVELSGDECGSVRQRIRQAEKRSERMRAK